MIPFDKSNRLIALGRDGNSTLVIRRFTRSRFIGFIREKRLQRLNACDIRNASSASRSFELPSYANPDRYLFNGSMILGFKYFLLAADLAPPTFQRVSIFQITIVTLPTIVVPAISE